MLISINKAHTSFMEVDDDYWNGLISYLRSYGIKVIGRFNDFPGDVTTV